MTVARRAAVAAQFINYLNKTTETKSENLSVQSLNSLEAVSHVCEVKTVAVSQQFRFQQHVLSLFTNTAMLALKLISASYS